MNRAGAIAGALSRAPQERRSTSVHRRRPPRRWPHSPKPPWPLKLFPASPPPSPPPPPSAARSPAQQHIQCDLLHRPSRAIATGEPVLACAAAQLEDATRVVYMPAAICACSRNSGSMKAYLRSSPAPSSRMPAQPGSRFAPPRSPALGNAHPALAPSLADRRLGPSRSPMPHPALPNYIPTK